MFFKLRVCLVMRKTSVLLLAMTHTSKVRWQTGRLFITCINLPAVKHVQKCRQSGKIPRYQYLLSDDDNGKNQEEKLIMIMQVKTKSK